MQLEEHTDIDLLITRYLSGKMDKESFAELKRWSLESESNRKYVRNKLEVWFSSGVADTAVQFDKDKAFSLFKQRIVGAEKKQKQMFRFSWKTFMRAAAVVLILMIPFAAYWQGKQAVKQSFADMVVEAPMGAHTKLYLPDGTLVWLNAGSKIIYSQGFGVDDRRLRLEGEGYFEVMKNEEVPFEIDTKELDLRVLGTKFNLRNYPDDEEVTVNLMEGKVALRNGIREMPELYLTPDEKMVLNKATGQMVKSSTKAAKANVWINDELRQCGQYGWLETLLQRFAVHYGDGHRQMPYIRFVSCSGYYHFVYSEVPGNACAVLCGLRKSRHCPKAGYRKE